MPFSARYNCLFVHIPRTAGTTVEKILGIHREWPTLDLDVLHGALVLGNQEYQLQHLSFREASQFLPKCTGNRFAFTFVRNPWDRMVSAYFWLGGRGIEKEFEIFVDRACEIVNSRQELEGRNCHFRPQVEFLDAQIYFVGRFESFYSDLNKVLTELRVSARNIPHELKTSHGLYAKYYSDRLRKRVASTYESDIDAFKYTFDGAGKV
jgi:chondroitin 4-sulfotransferase 11